MDGVVVSITAVGRSTGAVGSLDALPGIVAAGVAGPSGGAVRLRGCVPGRTCSSAGVGRRTRCWVARPTCTGWRSAGRTACRHVLRCLLTELAITLGLAGYAAVDELTPDALVRRP